VVGNIAAYGQAVADTLEWADVYDLKKREQSRIAAKDLGLEYRKSRTLQSDRSLLVIRAAFRLSTQPSKDIEYESALSVAREHQYDMTTLDGRRQAIIGAREKAGSLWDYREPETSRTAGSFFRNPLVDHETATRIMSYDETGKSLALLEKMNKVHGGDASRVSAAHVLLAAGFQRGQAWGDVRLHSQHVLKIENAGHARSQEIYDVAQEIITTVRQTLGVELDPEVRFLGQF
jgi:UDP-N-acetylmuramate dehydrogenase